jgi:uncharacterized protein YndB with AHSA1/START domain
MADVPYDIELSHILNASPARVYEAFSNPDQFAHWYGPDGFPVQRETVEIDARVGGRQRFTMAGDADPSMRTGFDGRFTDVVANELLSSSGTWHGIPGQQHGWSSNLRVEFHDQNGTTRLVVREGPHPEGTTEMGRLSWEMMFAKLDTLLGHRLPPHSGT